MKILVSIKRVVDYKTNIRVKADGSGIDTTHVKMSMNPFDEIAVEEAVRLKEKGWAKEIIVLSIGNDSCQETLRTALAMGADRAILIKTELALQPLAVAKLLKHVVASEHPDLVILGKQAIDTDDNQVGQMLAGLLDWPQATFASRVVCHDKELSVTREIDGGLETLLLTIPAVITTDLRLNEPRYLSLPNIVQAKRKPLDMIAADSLGIELTPTIEIVTIKSPEKRRTGVKLAEVSELVKRLKEEAHVI